jgi:hypothetical protein
MESSANVNSTQYSSQLFSDTNSLSSGNVNVLPNSFRTAVVAADASIMKGGAIPFLHGGKRRKTINLKRIRRISNRYKMRGKKGTKRLKQIKSRLLRRTRHHRK